MRLHYLLHFFRLSHYCCCSAWFVLVELLGLVLEMGAKEKIVVLCFVTVTSAAIGEPITLVESYTVVDSACERHGT